MTAEHVLCVWMSLDVYVCLCTSPTMTQSPLHTHTGSLFASP